MKSFLRVLRVLRGEGCSSFITFRRKPYVATVLNSLLTTEDAEDTEEGQDLSSARRGQAWIAAFAFPAGVTFVKVSQGWFFLRVLRVLRGERLYVQYS
jgi:cytochrome c biogenesis protein CcdA